MSTYDMDPLSVGNFVRRIGALEEDVMALHIALDLILPLFVQDHGWNYNCVDIALDALARNRDMLPTCVFVASKIDERKDAHAEPSAQEL